ncbi:MAG: 3-isopropylmalate dehydratase small subunit [Gammaproteobacteria bacterium]|nr:MAG: 3-isopropylmalate dehydratase small subunit [Gammaproteobacteria bacterium]
MKAFERFVGRVAPLNRANVDTDQIIPKQFLKSIRRTGFGDNLFDGWRYLDEGDPSKTPNERRINPDFVLNSPRYQGASILLAQDNFGCGSSREHAVWALEEYGFRVVLAPSFADIFFSNCFKNGVLPIVLDKDIVEEMFRFAESEKGLELTVDLAAQRLTLPSGEQVAFEVDGFRKHCLLEGLDDIGVTLKDAGAISDFEIHHRARSPWLFDTMR